MSKHLDDDISHQSINEDYKRFFKKDSNSEMSEDEYKKRFIKMTFNLKNIPLSLRELINQKIKKSFKKSDSSRLIREIIYKAVYERINQDSFLREARDILANIEKNKKSDNNLSITLRIIRMEALDIFEPIIDEFVRLKQSEKRATDMTGKKLSEGKKKEFQRILETQKQLTKEHGRCNKSSLSNSIRIFYKNQKTSKQVKSIATLISHHLKKGNLIKK